MDHETTRLLIRASEGDRASLDQLLPLVYGELKAIATNKMRNERANHTLQPTALVNEAFLRLVDQSRVQWKGRAHFCAVAAEMMRRILIDHARRRHAEKRGAGFHRVSWNEALAQEDGDRAIDVLVLDDLLEQLAALNERHARVVELRFFGGLGIKETAEVLGVSPATVKNDWRAARAWLMSRLGPEESDDS